MRTGALGSNWTDWRRVAAAVFLIAGLSGCGGGGPEVSVVLSEFAFEPSRVSIPRSQKTAIKLQNIGTQEHNFSVPQLGVTSLTAAPGKTVILELAVPRGGAPLKVICTIPGHEEAGMVGELVAVERPR